MAQRRRKMNMYDRVVFFIRVQGDLDESWCEYFGTQSMTVSVDKSALLGIINHLNALGLPLISVECLPE
jgi:hypothetical protein